MKRKFTHCRIPPQELIQQGFDLYYFCQKDKPILLRENLDWNVVYQVSALAESCNKAETAWLLCKDDKKIFASELKKMELDGRGVRSKLAKKIRKNKLFSSYGRKLPWYGQRKKQIELIEDLNELAVIGNKLRETDADCFPDTELIHLAMNLHTGLRKKVVASALFKDKLYDLVKNRNDTAKNLKKAIDEIHEAGQCAFAADPKSAARYAYQYHRIYNNKRTTEK